MPTTYAQTIDGNYIYAQRAVQDKNGDDIDQTYAKSASLATVATTGSYSDLSNTPSIPTDTSDLNNDSGFITGSDVPANQTQADWTESDSADPAYIQHKPTLATVATSGAYADLSGTPTVDQTYNSASSNAQSGVAVAGAIATKQDTISDLSTIRSGAQDGATAVQPGDLATVATSGDYSDLTNKPTIPAAQVQSNWSESNTSSKAYIQNKPTELPIVAGNGISITVVNGQIVISATGA